MSKKAVRTDNAPAPAGAYSQGIVAGGFLFTHRGYSGPAALERARSFAPEVVFLDIGLPGMNGYEVARRLRAEPNGGALTLVALTGWGTDDDRKRAHDAGFDHHLTKPVDAAQVHALLADRSAARPV